MGQVADKLGLNVRRESRSRPGRASIRSVQAESAGTGSGQHGGTPAGSAIGCAAAALPPGSGNAVRTKKIWKCSAALADDLAAKGAAKWAPEAVRIFGIERSPNAIRVTDREEVLVEDFDRALDRLYLKNVQSNVLEFRTHLPRYSLQAAAGKFLENDEITEEGWIEAPEDLRLDAATCSSRRSRAIPWSR